MLGGKEGFIRLGDEVEGGGRVVSASHPTTMSTSSMLSTSLPFALPRQSLIGEPSGLRCALAGSAMASATASAPGGGRAVHPPYR